MVFAEIREMYRRLGLSFSPCATRTIKVSQSRENERKGEKGVWANVSVGGKMTGGEGEKKSGRPNPHGSESADPNPTLPVPSFPPLAHADDDADLRLRVSHASCCTDYCLHSSTDVCSDEWFQFPEIRNEFSSSSEDAGAEPSGELAGV